MNDVSKCDVIICHLVSSYMSHFNRPVVSCFQAMFGWERVKVSKVTLN